MNTSFHHPDLHEKEVERALEALRTGKTLGEHPFQFFLSVLTRLESPHVLSGDKAVLVTIFEYLSELITRRLEHMRQLYDLPAPDRNCRDELLIQDFRQNNTELEGWSILYHRYVCIDRDFTMKALAARVNQTERNLRRRRRTGISRLTADLIKLEQAERLARTQQRLRLALPGSYPFPMVGRASLLQQAQQVLMEDKQVLPLVLHGPAGIGKTLLAMRLAYTLIENEKLEDMLWLDMPDTITSSALIRTIITQLSLTRPHYMTSEQVLRAYLFRHPTLIVLDGAEALLSAADCAVTTLAFLDSAYVIVTSRVSAPEELRCHRLTVPSLNRDQAFEFLDHIAGDNTAWLDRFDAIWDAVGGNPLALGGMLNVSRNLPLSAALLQTKINRLYSETWQQLSADERRIWLLSFLVLQDGLSYETFHSLTDLEHDTVNQLLDRLTSRALLTVHRTPDTLYYSVSPVATTFLFEHIRTGLLVTENETALDFIQGALRRQIVKGIHPRLALSLLKLAEDIGFSQIERWECATELAPQIMEAGLWQSWSEHLTSILDAGSDLRLFHTAWLHLMHGIALRWMGELDQAGNYLNRALEYYVDESEHRASALIELAVVARYQGRWDEARHLSEAALELFAGLAISDGIERCIHEHGQLALEGGDPFQGLAGLNRLEQWTARTWGIASQAHLLLAQLNEALYAAKQAVALLPVNHPNQGRAIAMLGQICHVRGEADDAIRYLLHATQLLDQVKDIIGHARACNNLAVAYLNHPVDSDLVPLEEIRRLLTQASQVQEHINDEIGLAVTRQNLTWLS